MHGAIRLIDDNHSLLIQKTPRWLRLLGLFLVTASLTLLTIYASRSAPVIATIWTPTVDGTTATLVPEMTLDVMALAVCMASCAGIVGMLRRSRTLILIYLSILLAFTAFQLTLSLQAILDPSPWISRSIEDACARASPTFIVDLEIEFGCSDYAIITETEYTILPCADLLADKLTPRLTMLIWAIFWIRLAQLAGVLVIGWLVTGEEQVEEATDGSARTLGLVEGLGIVYEKEANEKVSETVMVDEKTMMEV
jgi:hypothetical protein